tara:strand:+ start:6831 stop:7523 length:693 start_codon:yes stop_codon:yes gene_type:complete
LKFLIPPSEGKSKDNITNTIFEKTNFKHSKKVDEIIKKLIKIKPEDFKKIYGTTSEKSALIHKQNKMIKKSLCSPAILRYTGTVYSNINWQSFNDEQKEFFDRHFLIFSGLFGAVSPMTLIPNYKLKMNVLQLYKFWNPALTEELKKENLVVDLLPQIHKKAYTQHQNCVNIDFSIIKNGKKTPAGHNGKMIKGKFIQFVCRNMITKFEEMIQFELDGFKWDGERFLKVK